MRRLFESQHCLCFGLLTSSTISAVMIRQSTYHMQLKNNNNNKKGFVAYDFLVYFYVLEGAYGGQTEIKMGQCQCLRHE